MGNSRGVDVEARQNSALSRPMALGVTRGQTHPTAAGELMVQERVIA